MVREPKGDVAAVFMKIKGFGGYKIWVAKNRVTPTDTLQASRILGLFSGDAAQHYKSYEEFISKALSVVVPFSAPKMKSRFSGLTDPEPDLEGIIQALESAEPPPHYSPWDSMLQQGIKFDLGGVYKILGCRPF